MMVCIPIKIPPKTNQPFFDALRMLSHIFTARTLACYRYHYHQHRHHYLYRPPVPHGGPHENNLDIIWGGRRMLRELVNQGENRVGGKNGQRDKKRADHQKLTGTTLLPLAGAVVLRKGDASLFAPSKVQARGKNVKSFDKRPSSSALHGAAGKGQRHRRKRDPKIVSE
ncbi:unnamed protein product [Ectocarpus fasciculatus]